MLGMPWWRNALSTLAPRWFRLRTTEGEQAFQTRSYIFRAQSLDIQNRADGVRDRVEIIRFGEHSRNQAIISRQMSELNRIGVAIEAELLRKFDDHIAVRGYTNRSEAFRDM